MTDETIQKRIDIEQKLYYLIERERYEMAGQLLMPALAKEPENVELLYISAVIDKETGRIPEAERTLRELLSKAPRHDEARYLMSKVHIDKDEFGQAEQLIIELIRDYPNEPLYYTQYANVMLQTMHLEKAEKLAAEALRLDPENPGSLTVSILCSLAKSSNSEAKEKFSELMKNYPDAQISAHALYIILVENKQFFKAMRIAQELLRNNPRDEGYLAMVKSIRRVTHPAMLPLYPMTKWGWHASAVLWIVFIATINLSRRYLPEEETAAITLVLIGYIAYSWIAPAAIKKLFK